MPPMAFFNPLRPSYLQHPYPALARLRAEEPVHRSKQLDAWVLTRYEDCLAVLRDHERFSSEWRHATGRLGAQVARQEGEALLGGARRMVSSDPPEHSRLRNIVNRAFTPRHIDGMRATVEEEVAGFVDSAKPGEPFDVIDGLARPLPRRLIQLHLGVPLQDQEQLYAWADAIMGTAMRVGLGAKAAERARDARERLLQYLERYTDDGAEADSESLLAQVARAHEQGERPLTTEELLELTIDLLLAGNDTTMALIGNAVLALVEHPDQQALLRERPELIPNAIEEVLRFDAPTQVLVRIAKQEARLGRTTIAAGDAVLVMIAAANRDPERFDDPDRFDVTREEARHHLSLGIGIHYCVGSPLGRLEAATSLATLLDRLPELRVAEGAALPRSTEDWMMRTVLSLPLETGDIESAATAG